MRALCGQMVRIFAAVNILLLTGCFPAAASPSAATVRIVALGDSLTAGYMLTQGEAFPAQLERRLKAAGLEAKITNAGVSGDTTAAGLSRLDWAVPDGTDAVILELGANDALRGLDPGQARRNLASILKRLKARGVDVLLTGMLAPGNLGEVYATRFNAIFPALAQEHNVLLYPFFLQGVAMRSNLNLSDGLHPNARGVSIIVENILPKVQELIAKVRARRGQVPKG